MRHGATFQNCVAAGLVAAWALVCGWPTLHAGFLSGDDQRLILEHVLVNHPSPRHAAKLLTVVHGDLYQPLPMLSFQLNYAFAGPDPSGHIEISARGFHVTNVVLHGINSLLAFFVAARLARCRRVGVLTGLFFAAHPFAVEPVAWVNGRMILLATMFSLLVLLVGLNRREDGRSWWVVGGALAWLCALFSKVLPTVPLAAAWCDYRMCGRLPRRAWGVYAAFLAVGASAAWLALRSTTEAGLIEETQAEASTGIVARVLLAGGYYLQNYVWPSRLTAWSPPPEAVPLVSGSCGLATLSWACLGALALVAHRTNKTAYSGLVLFVILILPFLGAGAARRFLAADRYMYLPILGLHLAVAAGAVAALDALAKRFSRSLGRGLVSAAALALLSTWTAAGWRHAGTFGSSVASAARTVEVYPDSESAFAQLAKAHLFEGAPDAALEVARAAQWRWPDSARLAAAAGEALRAKGQWRQAEKELRAATRLAPNFARAFYYLGSTLEQLGETEEELACYRKILEQSPDYLPAIVALAHGHQAAGQMDEAARQFQRAIEVNPYDRNSRFSLATIHMRARQWGPASGQFRAILDLDPDDGPALLNLGAALANLGDTGEAIALFDRLLRLDPTNPAVRINRAGLLPLVGRSDEAEAEYRRLLLGNVRNRDAIIGLHELFQQAGRMEELVALWRNHPDALEDPIERRAWMAWAQVLAGSDLAAAASLVEEIPSDHAARSFGEWALAFGELARGDVEYFRRRMSRRPATPTQTTSRHEQARIIRIALASLPETVRRSAPGTYALVLALAFDGDNAGARLALRDLEKMPDSAAWAQDVAQLEARLNGE